MVTFYRVTYSVIAASNYMIYVQSHIMSYYILCDGLGILDPGLLLLHLQILLLLHFQILLLLHLQILFLLIFLLILLPGKPGGRRHRYIFVGRGSVIMDRTGN